MLDQSAARLAEGLAGAARSQDVPVTINRVGSMVGLYLTASPGMPVEDFDAVMATDGHRFATFFHALLEQGVMIAPSRFEALFVSLAHSPQDIDQTIAAAEVAFAKVAGQAGSPEAI